MSHLNLLILILVLLFAFGGTRLGPAYGTYSYGTSGILLIILILLLLRVI